MSCEHNWEEVKKYKLLTDNIPISVYTNNDIEYPADVNDLYTDDWMIKVIVEYECSLCQEIKHETDYISGTNFNNLNYVWGE